MVDVYGTMLRIIISSRVAHHFQDLIVETLESLLKPTLIILNTDSAFAAAEHLKETLLYYQDGQYFSPSKKLDPVRFREDNLYYEVAPGKGQKKADSIVTNGRAEGLSSHMQRMLWYSMDAPTPELSPYTP